MVNAINFAVRDFAGGTQHGAVAGDAQSNFIQVGSGDSVSLNLSRASVVAYEQQGSDLLIKLVDGRTIVLSGYFDEAAGDQNHLYLSSDGEIVEVLVDETGSGVLFANYGPVEGWGKWSPLDDLRFTDADGLGTLAVASNEPAGQAAFIPGLLGGFGGAGLAAAGVGAAVIGGGSGSGGGGGGGGGDGRAQPTVNAQPVMTVTTNTTNPVLPVSGTGVPGDTVKVTIGGITQTTTIAAEGTWAVSFPGAGLPPNGSHAAAVVVTPPTGEPIPLTGPGFVIDLTPPEVSVVHGTQSVHDVENLAEYANGVSIDGQGEPGASISVMIGTHTQTTTVAANGSWSVTFAQSQIAPGEYNIPVKITATDPLGNQTVLNDVVVIDTVPHPITFNAVTTDNLVNLAESQSGLVVTGTSTAGASMTVTLQGVVQTATVTANGTWSVTYPTGTLPAGEYTATLTATTTDAAGNASSATHDFLVDTLGAVSIAAPVAGDNIVNAAEAAGGVVLSGTAQANSTVSVTWNGSTVSSSTNAAGVWSVTYAGTSIQGGTYDTTATVTGTDAQGNAATASHQIRIDTEIAVEVNPGQAGGDNLVSGGEAASGLALTGTAEAGASVAVTFEGVTRTVVASSSGAWTANFAASEVRAGTYASTVAVSATDAAGNTATTTHAISVDTEVNPFTRAPLSTGTDTVVNAVEAAQGLTVTGMVEAGSSVVVRFGAGATHSAVVNTDGSWSLNIPASEIPAGEGSVTLTATATDRVGNVSTLSEQVVVDTVVRNFAQTGGEISGDGMVNANEAAAGITLTGTVEPGATVVLRLSNGETVNAAVGSDGNWTAFFASAQIPRGANQDTAVTMTATDRAGNVSVLSDSFVVDTVAPGSPEVVSFSRDSSGLRAIGTESTDDTYTFARVDSSGNTSAVAATRTEDLVFNETNFRFASTVPDGSYLVVNTADTAGNESSTLLIVNNTNALDINLGRAGLSGFDFTAIDLTFAPEANLTINESQLMNLTGPDHRLIIKGDTDDTVTLLDATDAHQTRTIDGQTYRLFTLGTAGASVLVDDDITTAMSTGV